VDKCSGVNFHSSFRKGNRNPNSRGVSQVERVTNAVYRVAKKTIGTTGAKKVRPFKEVKKKKYVSN